jgi:hypothetical protein
MERTSHTQGRPPGELVFDAFYSGAIGGSMVALFFLFVDFVRFEPLFTPSLMGQVLFGGADAEFTMGVEMPMVAAYTVAHFVSFIALGGLASFVVHEVELHSKHPLFVLGGLFILFEATFAIATGLLMPGVVVRIGPIYIGAANGLAAAGMGTFFLVSHRPGLIDRLRRAAWSGA